MDITEKYIEMCTKANELQDGYEPHKGDYIGTTEGVYIPGSCKLSYNEYHNYYYLAKEHELQGYIITAKFVWLPRQDQLQEMLIDELNNFRHISYLFSSWLNSFEWQSYQSTLMSFEQLWLAFVMWKSYQKLWNGLEWAHKTN